MKSHWEKVYNRNSADKLGWYEENPEPSLSLIRKCGLDKSAMMLNVGVGASTLVDMLLNDGYENIVANDLSSSAIETLKTRLGDELSTKVRWVVDDLTQPEGLNSVGPIDLWHDRAVLHFFNESTHQDSYFDLLKRLVKADGYVIIAAFNLDGAPKCSGLPVFRYNKDMLQEKLGDEFILVDSFDYNYSMPTGDTRAYIYTLFKREV